MATKPLPSQEALRQLLDYDPETGALTWRERAESMFSSAKDHGLAAKRWNGKNCGRLALNIDHGNGYLRGDIWGERFYAHRVVWKMMTGEEPLFIDHINGIRSDNRFCNLRVVTREENSRNAAKPSTNTSGEIGVSLRRDTGKWLSYIGDGKERIRIGEFATRDDAVAARKAAERRLGYHENHGR